MLFCAIVDKSKFKVAEFMYHHLALTYVGALTEEYSEQIQRNQLPLV